MPTRDGKEPNVDFGAWGELLWFTLSCKRFQKDGARSRPTLGGGLDMAPSVSYPERAERALCSRGTFPILPGILLSTKPKPCGNSCFLKRTMVEKNGESTPRYMLWCLSMSSLISSNLGHPPGFPVSRGPFPQVLPQSGSWAIPWPSCPRRMGSKFGLAPARVESCLLSFQAVKLGSLFGKFLGGCQSQELQIVATTCVRDFDTGKIVGPVEVRSMGPPKLTYTSRSKINRLGRFVNVSSVAVSQTCIAPHTLPSDDRSVPLSQARPTKHKLQ